MKPSKIIQLFSLLTLFAGGCKKETETTTTTPSQVYPVPTVISTKPLANATGIERNAVVTVTFSGAMDTTTISTSTFMVKQGAVVIPGKVVNATNGATFTPIDNLLPLTKYTATVTTSIKSAAGKALAENTEWSFTTGGTIVVPTGGGGGGGASGGLAPVSLGASANFVILAKTAINNAPTSKITGDLGLSPAATSYITGLSITNATGYATSSQVTGKIYAADMAAPTPINLTTSVNNMVTAYNDAAGRPSPDFVELYKGNIGGKTITPGLYKWSNTVTLPASVTLSGGPNDVWIFQIAGDLTASSAVKVTLNGGAQAKNVFWQVAGQVTIGTTSYFQGVILSMTGITLKTGASLNGRALAQSAVILDSNVVTQP